MSKQTIESLEFELASYRESDSNLRKRVEELDAELKLADEGLDFWQKKHTALVDGLRELPRYEFHGGRWLPKKNGLHIKATELDALLGKESEDGSE